MVLLIYKQNVWKIIQHIVDEVGRALKYYPDFDRLTWEISNNYGNEIVTFRFYLKEFKDYVYFSTEWDIKNIQNSNIDNLIYHLIKLWDTEDNADAISLFRAIIQNGQQYGWD